MKHILTLILVCSIYFVQAQNFIKKNYADEMLSDEWTSLHVSPRLFELSQHIQIETDDEDLQYFQDVIKQVTSLDIIAHDEHPDPSAEYKLAASRLEDNFDLLMKAHSKGEHVSCYISETNGVVHELIATGHQHGSFFLVDISGEMDIRELSNIMNRLNQGGYDQLKTIVDKDIDGIQVYPNPAKSGTEVTIEGLEDMPNAELIITDLSGRVIEQTSAKEAGGSISTRSMSPGTYIMQIQHEGLTVNRKFILQ